ncbi:hypothetical protein BATDEDRAFT_91619 [Batrachochytrium dendrobatidis JAM81]|uniref:Uncharacterized protein n=2 Tax=Batrachochytrium dendrobatidis TaxID=109871 RepID=F4PB59_BATDJ|nr:uncharacterized protein BATDEDRAFT_91619 [Batrachochytrium dendrobatidis JAM81]EGF77663.1 hypothetical protein BATDEDRAFT_91619 [Batrachochytrium dendrobatidis JAM81]KAK5666364.1 hypothetical protein QVD99_007121 [Batrachochytrium dendrobatidis]OAJ43073.1 hypothetical protein BDEG_26458 [Batrachochytrium dendrobatidis JEL423]|eukprot:XP_006681794.1 hypothetical protein BATDEDRAFT_91619 [Batrachochytrium dendrobatidis JAM81]
MNVSSAKGKRGTKKGAQRHQNSFAFTTNRFSPAAIKISHLPVQGVCQRCLDIIQWKKSINKYKPLTQPKKCTICLRKTVVDAYHVICKSCGSEKNCCAKCQQVHQLVGANVEKTNDQVVRETQEQQVLIEKLNERQRRSYLRKIGRGDSEGAEKVLTRAESMAKPDMDDWPTSDESDDDDDEDTE